MTTAERLISEFPAVTFPQQQKLETEIRELAVKTAAPNCYDRVWAFYDGSKITKTRDGFTAITPTADYSIKLRDNQCRTIELFINGACIDELVTGGVPVYEAVESVQGNAFWKAVAAGEIGEDAWITD